MNGHTSSKPVLYIPSPLHKDAYTHAAALGFDILTPEDERSQNWEEITDAVCLRQGKLIGDLNKAQKLRIIARNGTGYESQSDAVVETEEGFHEYFAVIDVAHCKELGIAVSYLPGFNAESVGEHTLAMCLSLTRRVAETDRKMREGKTLRSVDFISHSISGKTIGLVGMGAIAREVALKFRGAFNCKVLVYSPTTSSTRWTPQDPIGPTIRHERCASLEEMLPQCDIVSLNCPVLPETLNLINASTLALMKSTAVLLNLGRGPLVDEKALYTALKTRQIYGAALDCFDIEPATTADYGDLFALDNLVVTPHIAATTEEVTRESTIRAVQNCWDYISGRPELVDHRVA